MDIITIASEAEKIARLKQKYDICKKNRAPLERQWYVNVAFLFGKQHFRIRKTGQTLADRIWFAFERIAESKKAKATSNKILVYYRSLLSRLVKMKADVSAIPSTRIKRDIASAEVAQEALEDFWLRANRQNPSLERFRGMQVVLDYLFSYLLTFGRGYLKPYFNAVTPSYILQNGQVVEADVGEVEVKPLNPLNVVEDYLGRYIFEREIVSTDEVYNRYGVDIPPQDNVAMPDIQRQILYLIDKTSYSNIDDAVILYKFSQAKSKKYPQGREVVFTDTRILYDEPLDKAYKGQLPYFSFTWFDLAMNGVFQGLVEQLIPLQIDYNTTISKLANFKKWAGKIFVPDGAKLQQKWTDEDLQIIKHAYGREPKYVSPPNPPSFLFEDLARIEKDMQDIAMTHDPTLAQTPAGVKSGVAIQSLQEKDDFTLTPVAIKIEQKLENFCETVLDLMAEHYTEERLIQEAGKDKQTEIRSFMGYQVKGQRRIKVSLGSALPSSRVARQQEMIQLAQAGLIKPEEAKKYLGLGFVEEAIMPIDEQTAKIENEEMAKGILVEVQEWDNHKIHADVVRDYMEDSSFKDKPQDIKDLFIAHYKAHLQYLAEEMQANQPPLQTPPNNQGGQNG